PACVDDFGAAGIESWRDGGDAALADADVADPVNAVGRIDEPPTPDHRVIGGRRFRDGDCGRVACFCHGSGLSCAYSGVSQPTAVGSTAGGGSPPMSSEGISRPGGSPAPFSNGASPATAT